MIMRSVGLRGFSYINSNTDSKTESETSKMSKTDKSTSTENIAAASEKKNTSSLPDVVVEKIQKMARMDAENGVYMDNEFLAYNKKYMKDHISPNRSKLILLLTPMLRNARYTNGLPSFFKLPGMLFAGKLQVGAATGASMSIYDNSGTEILSYDNRNGWLSHPSKEESKYQRETTAIYYEAYKASRAEMQAGQLQNGGMATNSELDIRALKIFLKQIFPFSFMFCKQQWDR